MAGELLRFGMYEFDRATMQLWREHRLVHLQAQPKQALAYLLDHAGQVVSREDLCQAIWGADTHVDFERGLNFCISQVRTALRDDPARPVYIRTLPKEGYCFIAPVTPAEPVIEAAAAPGPRHRFHWLGPAVMVLLAAAFFAGYWFRTAHAATRQSPIVAVMRFDNESGNPDLLRFADNLTDAVVERLTVGGQDQYAVIGNAAMLRLPREQRDLVSVAQQLHARYVVLGQIQAEAHGDETRVLAHLIRLPDQTHIWVVRIDVRLDRQLADQLTVEGEIAQKIASDFAPRIAADQQHPLPQFRSR